MSETPCKWSDLCDHECRELASKDAKILDWANRIEELYRFQSGCPDVVAEMRKEVEGCKDHS